VAAIVRHNQALTHDFELADRNTKTFTWCRKPHRSHSLLCAKLFLCRTFDNSAITMAGGEANSYYQMPDGNDRAKDYPMQPQQAYNQNGQQHYQQQNYQQDQGYSQPPPNYGQNFNPRPEMNGYDGKPVFAGYVVVSGISLQGYGM
jgi:hypothetical protein